MFIITVSVFLEFIISGSGCYLKKLANWHITRKPDVKWL